MNRPGYTILLLWSTWLLAGCSDYEMVPHHSSAPSDAASAQSLAAADSDQPAGKTAAIRVGRTVTSNDGVSAVTVPPEWRPSRRLHGDANVQVEYPEEELYLGVLTELKSESPCDSLRAFYETTRPQALRAVRSARASEPQMIDIGGLHAIRYEVTGMRDRHEVFYLHTLVEGKDHFHNVVAWTKASKLPKNRRILESVANSFREINN